MALFGFGKKKNQQPAPAPKPEPKQVSGPPHQHFILVDGQWYINPNYDPSAPKPEQPVIIGGLDDDDEDQEDDDD